MNRRDFLAVGLGGVLTGATGAKPGAHRPNILFCIADDASYPHMGAYGCSWVRTPGFDRVARDGVLFSRAYTPNAKCAPSRACILTGRNSWQLEEAANHWCFFPAKFKTYPEALSEHAYFVGFTAKGWGPGVPGEVNGKPRQLTGVPFNAKKVAPPAAHMGNNDYAANFEDFLAARPKDQPFCFWFGGTEPHRAYEFGAGISKGQKRLTDIPKVYPFWPDNEVIRTDLLDYAFELEYFDQHLQRMLRLLETRGLLDDTLVVVTADNGMPFPRIKGQAYDYSNHLPLAMMWPNGIEGPGRRVDDYVSFIDFAPTFLELAGVNQRSSGMQPIEGRSLTDISRSRKVGKVTRGRDSVLIGKERHDVGRPGDAGYPIRGIVRDETLYLCNFEPDRWPAGNPETGYLNCDGSPTKTECIRARTAPGSRQYWEWSFGRRPSEELYDLRVDRDCLRNLADSPQHQDLRKRLREEMFDRLRKQGDPRMFGRGNIFDRYPYADESGRNFYERYMKGEQIKAGWVNPSDFEKKEPE